MNGRPTGPFPTPEDRPSNGVRRVDVEARRTTPRTGRHRSPARTRRSPSATRLRALTAAVFVLVLMATPLTLRALFGPGDGPVLSSCRTDASSCTPPETAPQYPASRPASPITGDSAAPTDPTPPAGPSASASPSATREPGVPSAGPRPGPAGPDGRDGRDGRDGPDGDDRERDAPRALVTRYATQDVWGFTFTGSISVTNPTGVPQEAGRLTFGYHPHVDITSAWGAAAGRRGGRVYADLGIIAPGATVTVSFQAMGGAGPPRHCTLGRRPCF
ncbi:cellulose binding domain-containing protein [Thermomonospora umbrina]|uniref:Cellulose binding domain-containing protein n=1 Tax=Thermomonospora umbrina TaxID=111806 RepID=A0A3D9SUQ4_9ACTN|nr:cellulose binding domain-containing protein [Thermomonospora umbrina]REE96735.1 cellulose binding domain-containing protein [Thermomonospora umbrina]